MNRKCIVRNILLSALIGILSAAILGSCQKSPMVIPKVDIAELRAEIDKRRGQVVVLDVWATSCAPCVEVMPWFQQLHQTQNRRGVAVVGLNQDLERDLDSRVVPFLKKRGFTFPQLMATPEDYGAFVSSVHPHWGGGMPATFIYDKEGKLAKAFLDAESDRETFFRALQQTIDALLAK